VGEGGKVGEEKRSGDGWGGGKGARKGSKTVMMWRNGKGVRDEKGRGMEGRGVVG